MSKNLRAGAFGLLAILAAALGAMVGLSTGCAGTSANASYHEAVRKHLAVCEAGQAVAVLQNPAVVDTVKAALKKQDWESQLTNLGLSVGVGQLACILHAVAAPALDASPAPAAVATPASAAAHALTTVPKDCPNPQDAVAYAEGCDPALRAVHFLAEHRKDLAVPKPVPTTEGLPGPTLSPTPPAAPLLPASPVPAAPAVPAAAATPPTPAAPSPVPLVPPVRP